MVRNHTKDENSIILGVTAANGEVSDSGSISMMKEFDPTFKRSIGVLTKIDMADEGQKINAKKIINQENKDFNLKNGWFALKNKSYEDNADGKTVL